MSKRTILTLVAVASWLMCLGQKDDLYTLFKSKYPEELAIYVHRGEVLNIVPEGDSLRLFSDVFEEMVHLKEQSEVFANKRVYGSHFNQVENLRAKTLLWEKNRYKEIVVSEFKKNTDRAQGIFYDDSYYYSFNFPSVGLRNRTQLEYREQLRDPKFLTGFIFSNYLPQAKVTFTIKTTKNVDLYFEVINDPDSKIKFSKTEKGNAVTYEWVGLGMPSLKTEERGPSLRYTAPTLICYVKSFQTKNGRKNVLSGLDDLYSWYYSFIEDLDKDDSDELKGIVRELQAKSETEIDLVKNVFYWVQSNVRYIAFEQGMRGLIPHPGSYVCEKRYGDCKDMANLIVTMLRMGGVKAYHTWVGTRDLPYRYTKVPTPLTDNHMIATYISHDGTYYYLDATGEHTPFGLPSSMIQGKEVLISKSPTSYEVKEVPVIPMEVSFMTDSMHLQINDNTLKGTGVSTLNGFAKVFGAYELDRAETDLIKKYVTKLLGKGSNKFYLDNYAVSHLADRDTPTQIDYQFRISDYYQKVGDEIFVNLNLNKDYYNAFINTNLRKTPYENEYPYIRFEHISMKVPDGYEVEYLPENFSASDKLFGCEIKYAVDGDTILYRKKFYLNYLLLDVSDFGKWNDTVKKFSEAYKESVILKKK